MKKVICSSIAALSLTIGYSNLALADKVLAKYNNMEVKESELDEVMQLMTNGARSFKDFPKEMQGNVVKGYITSQLIYEEAKKSNVEELPEFKKEMEQWKKNTIQKYFLKDQVKNKVPEDKVKEEYEKQVAALKDQEEVKVRHILVKEENEIKSVLKELDKKGKNFEEVAKKHSIDNSKASGGELGYIRKGQTTGEFEKTAFSTKVGTISAPFKTDFGWHILKVEERRKVKVPPFEEQKPIIAHQMEEKAVQEYAEELLKNANVEILVDEKK